MKTPEIISNIYENDEIKILGIKSNSGHLEPKQVFNLTTPSFIRLVHLDLSAFAQTLMDMEITKLPKPIKTVKIPYLYLFLPFASSCLSTYLFEKVAIFYESQIQNAFAKLIAYDSIILVVLLIIVISSAAGVFIGGLGAVIGSVLELILAIILNKSKQKRYSFEEESGRIGAIVGGLLGFGGAALNTIVNITSNSTEFSDTLALAGAIPLTILGIGIMITLWILDISAKNIVKIDADKKIKTLLIIVSRLMVLLEIGLGVMVII